MSLNELKTRDQKQFACETRERGWKGMIRSLVKCSFIVEACGILNGTIKDLIYCCCWRWWWWWRLGRFSSKFLHKCVQEIAVLFVSQSPTVRLEHDKKKKKEKEKGKKKTFQTVPSLDWEDVEGWGRHESWPISWSGCGTAEALNGNASTLMWQTSP